MNRVAARAWIAVVLILALLCGFIFFLCEYFAKAEQWVMFPGSPHVYSAGMLGQGKVVDRDNILLLDMTGERTYSADSALRSATVHWLGDRSGNINAPLLSNYASSVVGYDVLNGVYNYANDAGTVKLTLAADVQKVALSALDSRKGTVAVYNYKTGEILCAVTTPTYDPDCEPDIGSDTTGAYDGVYLNRFTQSAYVPGSIFKIVTMAAAVETIPDITEQTFTCTGALEIGPDKITCEGVHGQQDLRQAFRNSCNCAFAQIAQQLGGETLGRYVEQFGITAPIAIDGINTEPGSFEIAEAQVNVAWSAIGQYNDQINPAAFLNFVGAVANGGKGVSPYLVSDIRIGSSKTYEAKTQRSGRIMSAATAQLVCEYMGFNVTDKYGSENFPGLTVCAKTGTAEVGGDKRPNAMLAGFTTDQDCPLAFVICVEDAGYGASVCIPIASQVLEACKTVLRGG